MSNKITSLLTTIGKDFKKGLDFILPFAQAATAGIAVINPVLGTALSTTIAVIAQTEQKFTAMGQQNGSGAQKLSESITVLEPALTQIFAANNIKVDTTSIQNYINGVVAMLNAIPAPATS